MFLKVEKDLFKLGLNPNQVIIIAQILEYQEKGLKCFISNEALSDMLNVSVSTIKRELNGLTELGILNRKTHVKQGGSGGKERFMLINTAKIDELLNAQNDELDLNEDEVRVNLNPTCCLNEGKGQNEPYVRVKLNQGKGQIEPIKDNIKDNILKDKSASSSSSSKNPKGKEISFDDWWNGAMDYAVY